MGFKVFSCVICGKEVSRRKSVWLKVLDGRDGRACKDHPEVIKIIKEKVNAAQMIKDMEMAEKNIRVIVTVKTVRALYTVHGTHPESVYLTLRARGESEDVIQAVKAEIAKKGPKMSLDEILDSLITYSTVLKSQKD